MDPTLPTPGGEQYNFGGHPELGPPPSSATHETAPDRQVEGTHEGLISSPPVARPVEPIGAQPSLQGSHSGTGALSQTALPVASSPHIADDVDLIEKEWVDKAKQIVKETKDDPYQQESKKSDLQVEYIKKRYNKDIKRSG